MKLRIALVCAPTLIALVVSVLFFVPKGDTIGTYKIWVPESGKVGSIADVELPVDHVDNGVKYSTYKDVHEVSLKEFQDHHYQNVIYGIWFNESSDPYIFYWVRDSNYPKAGVWTRVHLEPGFGRISGMFDPYYYQRKYGDNWFGPRNPAHNLFADFEGDQVNIPLQRDMEEGKTTVPKVGPKPFYWGIGIITFFATVLIVMVLAEFEPKEPDQRPFVNGAAA